MSRPQILIVLLAVASLGTAAMIVLATLHKTSSPQPPPPVTAATSKLLDQPIAGPTFSLTERSGRTFESEQLAGRVWVANFIFTRCPGICPPLSRNMADLQQQLSKRADWADIRLLSFSVEPEHDTPPRLQAYAEQYGAGEHWLFLTGRRDTIWRLCREGFKQTVQENPSNPTIHILHTATFVLVDQRRATPAICGFYDGLDKGELEMLVSDMDKLLAAALP